MNDILRIALVLDRFERNLGGLESWTEGLARWLAGRGHEVSVVAFRGTSPHPAIRLHTIPYETSPLARAAAVARHISRLSVDIVHDTGTADCAGIFQPQTGSRLLNTEVDVAARSLLLRQWSRLSPRFRRWRREMAVLERRQFADPTRLIAVSRMVRDQISQRYHLDPHRITVIHNGVDTKRFAPERLGPLREGARRKWSLALAPVFLLVGNNYRLKGVATAIRALARLSRGCPDVQLAVVGADEVKSYSRLAARLGVAGQVRFLGRVERIDEAYAAADVALQPTHYDACSLATLEGLASGLPTITTRTNGAGELITPGQQGLLLENASDADALADAMERLLDPELRRGMAAAARQLSLDHDIESNYARIEAFYRGRLSRPARAAACLGD
jgi:UDP-glucose:(heptosyl)LPS alpha-1,3-glucosyltransferase